MKQPRSRAEIKRFWRNFALVLALGALGLPGITLLCLEAVPKIIVGNYRLKNYWAKQPWTLAQPNGFSRSRMNYGNGVTGEQYPIDYWSLRLGSKG